MKPFKQVYLIIIVIGLLSCHSGQLDKVLQQADSLMENDPDSALELLSSFPHP